MFCDFHGFTPFAETSEPEEVMGVLRDYHAGRGRALSTSTRARWSASPATGSWSSSTTRCPATTRSSVRCACPSRSIRDAVQAGRRMAPTGHELTHRTGIAQGYATLGRIGFEGRFDYAAIGSVTNLAARLCGDAGDLAGPGHRPGAGRGRATAPRPSWSATCSPRASRAVRCTRPAARHPVATHDDVHRRHDPDALSELDEAERYAAFDQLQKSDAARLGRRCGSTSPTSRWSSCPRSAWSGRRRRAAPSPRRMEERSLFLLLLLRQPRLRMIYVTSSPVRRGGHRVLPGPAARRDPAPRPRPADHGRARRRDLRLAERQAAGPSAGPAGDRGADPQPRPRAT